MDNQQSPQAQPQDQQPPVNPAPAPDTVITPQVAPAAPVTPDALAQPAVAPVSQPATEQVVQPAPEPVTPPNPVPQPVAAPASPAVGGGKKILLVEDDDALANVYQTRLESEGFNVRRVPNGEEALTSALEYKPDLIVLDVMMPKVSGFDVLDILRNTPETASVKVVMLTALSQDADKERAVGLGVDEYLVKSQVVIADVVERIQHQLGINPS
jgi:CheY-like chemotaxis protein